MNCYTNSSIQLSIVIILKSKAMKAIIERRLPLNVRYTVTDKKYIPVLEGGGCTCDNCGKLIANIATIKSVNGTYSIGFDCLETFLLNNSLLDGFDVEQYEAVKRMIPQVIRFSKSLKQTISANPNHNITGLLFEKPVFVRDWFTFFWLKNNQTDSRDNDVTKIKGMQFEFLIETLKNIFPNLQILTK
jgi:hypothetical protein